MNRRDFLRRSALIAAGVVAADQLELLARLTHRKVFPGWSPAEPYRWVSKNNVEMKASLRRLDVSIIEGNTGKMVRVPPDRILDMGDGQYRVSFDTHEPGPILLLATAAKI